MTDPQAEPVKPWRWPGMWFRDEKFWRDVGSRTLAAVIAAGIIYVFAVAGGYVSKPKALPVLALLTDIFVNVLWYNKTTKLNRTGWYYTKPHWLIRIIEYALNGLTAVILLWILTCSAGFNDA